MTIRCWSLFFLGVLGFVSDAAAEPEVIFHSGRIYTMEGEGIVFEAMALADGRIVAIGTSAEVLSLAGERTRRIDLGGRTVLPGLVDAHCHLLTYGRYLRRLDLTGTTSFAEVLEKVEEAVGNREPGVWIEGRGWDQNDWDDQSLPTNHDLNDLSPENPVYLERVDGHMVLANHRALELAGIGAETADPRGGRIFKVEGQPTGLLLDKAAEIVEAVVPEPTRADDRAAVLEAQQRCLAAGLTGVHTMGVKEREFEIYRELETAGLLKLRIYAVADSDDRLAAELLDSGPREETSNSRLVLRAVKFYIDGALGSRGAALLAPYSDDPGNTGLLIHEPEEFYQSVRAAHDSGLQICTHAIGDRGNRIVLDAYERLNGESPRRNPRHRIEHAQVLAPTDLPRFAALGVLASMQFTHCTSDMPWAPDRLGEERVRGAYAWRQLLSTGARLVAGSDFPIESIDPFRGVYAAVTTSGPDGLPLSGFRPEERLTVYEAFRSFSVEPAYASFLEDRLGTLAPGMLADFIVTDIDPMRADARDLLVLQVLATFVSGEMIHGSLN